MSYRSAGGIGENRDLPESGPLTDYNSRLVISDAELDDPIEITEIVQRFGEGVFPERVKVVERVSVYHGPEVVVSDGDSDYLLTAPGPDSHLLIWAEVTDSDGFRIKWKKMGEIKAKLAEGAPGYRRCEVCGEPIQSADHDRLSVLGRCTNKKG